MKRRINQRACSALLVSLAALLAIGCEDNKPDHWEYQCQFPIPGSDNDHYIVGTVCIEEVWAEKLNDQACEQLCEEWQAEAPEGDAIHDYDCNVIQSPEITHKDFPCTPQRDWEEEILGEVPITHRYRCASNLTISCTNTDRSSSSYGVPNIEVCPASQEESLTDIHDRCIDECQGLVAQANAQPGTLCELNDAACNGIQFPQTIPGETCGGPSGIVPDPDGDQLEHIAWSTSGAHPVSLPLACSYKGNCCEAYGADACRNIELGLSRGRPVAQRERTLRGTLALSQDKRSGSSAAVEAKVRYSTKRCSNLNGTCPLYLEALDARATGVRGTVYLAGTPVAIEDVTIALEKPVLGAFDQRSGELKLPKRQLALIVSGRGRVNGKSTTFRHRIVVPDEIAGVLDISDGIVSLEGLLREPGGGSKLELKLRHQPAPSRTYPYSASTRLKPYSTAIHRYDAVLDQAPTKR